MLYKYHLIYFDGLTLFQVYEYDDFYFLTDPEQLIYSHWAHRKEWQLLVQPITLQDFENLPLVKSYFFKCGMFFVSHHNGVVETKKGQSGGCWSSFATGSFTAIFGSKAKN